MKFSGLEKRIEIKLNIKISEGKRRLRILTTILLSIGTYLYLVANDSGYRNEERIFIVYPLVSVIGLFLSYFLMTAFYWVLDGFEKSHFKKPGSRNISNSSTTQDVEILSSSFIRSSGNRFDSFVSKKRFPKLFRYHGPYFAWSILWLAICKTSKPDASLKSITITCLKRVLKVNHNLTKKTVDTFLEKKGGSFLGLKNDATGNLIGADMDKMFEETNEVFIDRLESAICASLERTQSDGKNKFVPILDLLMSRNSNAGSKTQFDQMSDDEFENIFLEQCVECFTLAKNMAYQILEKYRRSKML